METPPRYRRVGDTEEEVARFMPMRAISNHDDMEARARSRLLTLICASTEMPGEEGLTG
jgi:hypothetical protein